jgi:hypothetical protein
MLPQVPQFKGSVWNIAGSTQPVPHCTCPTGHDATHAPVEQNGVAAPQTLPQAPQLLPSACKFTQPAPQFM